MATLLLEVESRENLGPVVSERLVLQTVQLSVSELIAERARSKTGHLSPSEQEVAVSRALEAFCQNAFLLIVDDLRRTDPDERLQISADSRVRFWRLTPLQGG